MASYSSHFSVRRLWTILAASMLVMFGTLLYFGREIYQAAPPIPTAVRTEAGDVVFTGEQILRGQNVWQSLGGMQQGSVWGHGSYVAPDWSADWLHREAQTLLDRLASQEGVGYAQRSAPDQARLRELLRQAMRTNTYDPQSGVVTITGDRALAIALVGTHYSDLFRDFSLRHTWWFAHY
jgi:nitric oxide reductase subunit B